MSDHGALLVIREARGDDLDPLHALIESAYRGPESLTGWTSEGDRIDGQRLTRDQLAAVLADPSVTMLVAEIGGAVVGCASVSVTAGGAEFGKFAVRPALQNAGTGKALLAACEALLAARGGGVMTMTVIEGRTELAAFYARRGYTPTGETLPLASVHGVPGWTVGRDLVLEVLAKPIAPAV
ncbi:MAG: GNAT family N-acetyltransferase [Hyphomonadaceae bacterium]|jgi:N-acetylglutamate synthase-like GNAT family acetyltransferase|nr:GNAT family N-acetyltransferase [Hyphomonadaceae bacterium]